MPNYLGGLIEGFSGAREAQVLRKQQEDASRRQMESKIFDFLLNSEDKDMQALAVSGLFESARPGRKSGGLRGYLGDLQAGDIYPQVRARMDEYIPDTPTTPTPPARPGSAAMSTNAPVQAGSAPIQLPGRQLPPETLPDFSSMRDGQLQEHVNVTAPMPPDEPMGAPPQAPSGPPPASTWKKRGTGVPTAEEIAEMQARVPLQTRIRVATDQLRAAGASPEEIQQAVMGILGAPQRVKMPSAISQFGAKLPDGRVVPLSFDPGTKQYFLPDGTTPFDTQTMSMVRMAGSTGGASLTSRIPDSPEGRQYLIAQGADPTEVSAGSPTGYWKISTRPDGTIGVQADIFIPPPVFSSTPTVLDQSGTSTVMGVTRGGQTIPLGTAPSPQATTGQSNAAALLADVQARIRAAETPRLPGSPRRPLTPQARDTIVREAAAAAQLPYTSYYQLEQATRTPPARQVAPRANAPATPEGPTTPPGSKEARLAQRAREIDAARGGTRGKPVPFGTPPPAPPTR